MAQQKAAAKGNTQAKGRWKKGESGNPNGRTPLPEELKNACKRMCWEYLPKIEQILQDDSKPHFQLRAWEVLALRGFGAPRQEIDVTTREEQKLPPVIYAPIEAKDAEEWERRFKPRQPEEKLN